MQNAFGKHFYSTVKSPHPNYNGHISASLLQEQYHTDTEIQRQAVLL